MSEEETQEAVNKRLDAIEKRLDELEERMRLRELAVREILEIVVRI